MWIKGLRERQEYEVPNQSGICLIRGFIADDGGKSFKANTAVRFAKQTDMRLEMLHGAVLQPGDLSFFINFYGLTLFAAGSLNNGGVNDGGGCFLYF